VQLFVERKDKEPFWLEACKYISWMSTVVRFTDNTPDIRQGIVTKICMLSIKSVTFNEQ